MTASNPLSRLLSGMADVLDVDSVEAMAIRVIGAALILLTTFWIARALRGAIGRRVKARDPEDANTNRVYGRSIQVVVLLVGVSTAVHTLGINLTHLFTAGGLLAVAAAFAMKNLAENLVGGLILRLENTIKPGDVLRIQGDEIVKVKRIGFRITTVRSKSEGDLVIPNAELVQNPISNYTYNDELCRIDTTVGVAYDSDLEQVRATLQDVCDGLGWKSEQRRSQIELIEFGNSSVNFKVLVWVEDPWSEGHFRSDLNWAIWWALKDAGVVIALPQLDVHVVAESAVATDR
ncbi:MAG: mechanosensitive ion channel [Gammaproteobacteria bacterium]|nr:mechanosensitive ion channel [Gammaproteobacteria bacterium]